MRISKMAFTSLLSLSLTLFSLKISSQELPKPESYTQLPREQKEAIAICFEENFECHQALRVAARVADGEWEDLLLAGVIGAAASIFLEHQLRH